MSLLLNISDVHPKTSGLWKRQGLPIFEYNLFVYIIQRCASSDVAEKEPAYQLAIT